LAITKVTSGMVNPDPTNASNLSSGDVPLAQLGNAPATDTTTIEDDIALLGFKVAVAGTMAKYNLVDQTEDAFVDQTGIDAGDSTGEIWNSGKYFSGISSGNYFGDDSDGAVTISTDTNETVLNKSGSYDGDMLVKNYTSLTIDVTKTLTLDQPARGMLIYVSGDCVINGTLSMSSKGAYANPTVSGGSDASAVSATGIRLQMLKSGSTDTLSAADFAGCGNAAVTAVANHTAISGNGKIYTIGQIGAAGGAGGYVTAYDWRNNGADGTTGQSGGGASGGGYAESGSIYIGAGVAGTCFSGGGGGGGAYRSSGGLTVATDATAYGGPGGNGGGTTTYGVHGGGAGNPGGTGAGGVGGNGTGGLCFLLVGGDLTIGASGQIVSSGISGANSTTPGGAGGGGSGGGNVIALHSGTLSNSGSVTAPGGPLVSPLNRGGGKGGDGDVVIEVVDTGDEASNMTLVSEFTEAEDTPTKGDIVMTYTNGVPGAGGVTAINTDLKAYASRDDGSNWTQLTLAAQGSTGAHFIVSSHNVDISSQPSDKTMRYKIETLNQGAAKETRIQAVSLGWS
jgi:hypothetical protein